MAGDSPRNCMSEMPAATRPRNAAGVCCISHVDALPFDLLVSSSALNPLLSMKSGIRRWMTPNTYSNQMSYLQRY